MVPSSPARLCPCPASAAPSPENWNGDVHGMSEVLSLPRRRREEGRCARPLHLRLRVLVVLGRRREGDRIAIASKYSGQGIDQSAMYPCWCMRRAPGTKGE